MSLLCKKWSCIVALVSIKEWAYVVHILTIIGAHLAVNYWDCIGAKKYFSWEYKQVTTESSIEAIRDLMIHIVRYSRRVALEKYVQPGGSLAPVPNISREGWKVTVTSRARLKTLHSSIQPRHLRFHIIRPVDNLLADPADNGRFSILPFVSSALLHTGTNITGRSPWKPDGIWWRQRRLF